MNYKLISYTLGWVLIFEALSMILSVICGLCFKESAIISILISMGICLMVGIPLVIKKPKNKTIYSKEGFMIVALTWIVISLFGALPFVISGAIPSYIDAFFETVSGFTTTGASILTDVEALPKCLLFWRSFTHWIGGMGILVFILAIIVYFKVKFLHRCNKNARHKDLTVLLYTLLYTFAKCGILYM